MIDFFPIAGMQRKELVAYNLWLKNLMFGYTYKCNRTLEDECIIHRISCYRRRIKKAMETA